MILPLQNDERFRRGVYLFNRAHFFEAHEFLEDVWRSMPSHDVLERSRRLHIQGVVQLAVAFHHQSTGNFVGALSVLKRALRNLDGADASVPDLDLDPLRVELALWQTFLQGRVTRGSDELSDDLDEKISGSSGGTHHTAPPLPKILRRDRDC
jgi:predicted metal-dependent hydrolase